MNARRPHVSLTTAGRFRAAWWLMGLFALALAAQPLHAASRPQWPVAARDAQSPIVIDSIQVVHTFGGQMIFALAAHSQATITEATLLLRVSADSRTEVLAAEFTPGLQIDTRLTRDLQADPITPFASLVYAWRVSDSAGNSLTTPEATYFYEDNRFSWQTAARGAIHAHWYRGDFRFGQRIADIGYDALNRASRLMNASLPGQVDVYVYETLSDLQAGLRLSGRTWVGGHADPALGVVLVYAAPDPTGLGLYELENTLAHELSHVMIYQIVAPGYEHMPVWLDEGLATNGELQPNPAYAAALASAVKTERLLSLEALCGPFGVDASQAILSYAESASVVRYIQDRWGPAAINDLLEKYREGASCQGGVQAALKISLAELQADWERDVLRASPLTHFVRESLPYLLVFGPIVLILAALIFVPRRTQPQPESDDGRGGREHPTTV